jgi:hypothetical protein
MSRATRIFLVAASVLAINSALAKSTRSTVTFASPCVCQNSHGVDRWPAKTDDSVPPTNRQRIRSTTPSQVYRWAGPSVHLTRQSRRIAAENQWYALTGRVVDLKVEADGDIHIVLQDANGPSRALVGAEVPPGSIWCPIRRRVFSWTRTTFPFHITSNRTLRFQQKPVITVVGKAFYDVDHAPRNQTNRRNNMPSFAVWEIHPVMQLTPSR